MMKAPRVISRFHPRHRRRRRARNSCLPPALHLRLLSRLPALRRRVRRGGARRKRMWSLERSVMLATASSASLQLWQLLGPSRLASRELQPTKPSKMIKRRVWWRTTVAKRRPHLAPRAAVSSIPMEALLRKSSNCLEGEKTKIQTRICQWAAKTVARRTRVYDV